MSAIDWLVLACTLLLIVLYGIWKSRGLKNMDSFLLANKSLPWYHVGITVMATQASAITFLSAPGQAYSQGMSFVQFYFGLPLAMVVLCVTFIPIFHKLKVYTAYEFLEKRFDMKTRALTASLFLLQRSLSNGITIYAPAIILSVILGVSIHHTILIIGILVIIYTVYGGSQAVSHSHLLQMGIIFSGMFMAGWMVVHLLPGNIGFVDALKVAGKMEKLNVIDLKFDLNNRYNLWSGLIGGFFLALSYFGTDQTQVGRYLAGSSVTQSRLGLVMNGLLKVPMQFFILMIGALVFVYYQYNQPPIFFNPAVVNEVKQSELGPQFESLEKDYQLIYQQKNSSALAAAIALEQKNNIAFEEAAANLNAGEATANTIRKEAIAVIKQNNAKADVNDSNYVFLHFVTTVFPVGFIGLLIAIIFLAAMGATASGLNALASTTVVDIYKRLLVKDADEKHYLTATRWITIAWGVFCIIIAEFAGRLGNLIEAVNILGSLFYGTILGIFLVAFYLKKIKGATTFYAALIAEALVILIYYLDVVAFLWLNVIGCLLVMGIALIIDSLKPRNSYA